MRYVLAPGWGSAVSHCQHSVCTPAWRPGQSSSCLSLSCPQLHFLLLLWALASLTHAFSFPCIIMSLFTLSFPSPACLPSQARILPHSQTHPTTVVCFLPHTPQSLPQPGHLLCPFCPSLACTPQPVAVLAAAGSITQMYRFPHLQVLASQQQSDYPWP